ncbi:MAG: glycosyltransferase family 1 protein [Chloroflexi bacterium]|nr:glycosyltransferase family 1 protein [Chloroflexota bacterium]
MSLRILCFSIDLPGHLDWGGFLKTAQALQERGHEVVWASGSGVEGAVRAAGLRFVGLKTSGWRHNMPPLPDGLDAETRAKMRRERALAVWLSPKSVLAALAELENRAGEWKPDVVLAEPYAAAGALLAEKLDLPLVVVGRPALPETQGAGQATTAVMALCQAAGVRGDYWDLPRGMPRSPHLHLDFFCRAWYADLPQIAPQTVFCGGLPASPRPLPFSPPDRRPLVLVTLGSTFADDETFFRLAAESAQMVGCQSLLVTGRRAPQVLASLREAPPGRATVLEWVDYDAVFLHLRAIVHHGGVATTHAALVHGVPQVVVPHAGDQFPQAARVTQAGVGYGIRAKDFTVENAPLILADVVHHPDFRERAAALAAEMHELGGVRRAAGAITDML